jgi:hypothetical protein
VPEPCSLLCSANLFNPECFGMWRLWKRIHPRCCVKIESPRDILLWLHWLYLDLLLCDMIKKRGKRGSRSFTEGEGDELENKSINQSSVDKRAKSKCNKNTSTQHLPTVLAPLSPPVSIFSLEASSASAALFCSHLLVRIGTMVGKKDCNCRGANVSLLAISSAIAILIDHFTSNI